MENGEMFNQNRINGQKWKTDKKVRFCSESFPSKRHLAPVIKKSEIFKK